MIFGASFILFKKICMKPLFFLFLFILLVKITKGQCNESFSFESTKNKLIYNDTETPVNFIANIEKVKDTIFIRHEIMGQKTIYKGYIQSVDCKEWNKETHVGKIEYFVEEVSNKKKYKGKVIIVFAASGNQVISELDSVEGLYKMNYEISKSRISED